MDTVQTHSRTNNTDPRSLFKVPKRHESVLAIPALADIPALVQHNSDLLATSQIDFHGISLARLRQDVRTTVLAQASRYTQSVAGHSIELQPGPLIVTGHQPELFHAGVWAKNFATAGFAQRQTGTSLNLIIDNDTVTTTQVRVPLRRNNDQPNEQVDVPAIELIPFDSVRPEQPWEEAVIIDRNCLNRFGERCTAAIRKGWNYEPIVSQFWPAAREQFARLSRLCDCLTAARMAAESSMDVRNLEVPMSAVCETLPFGIFAAALLADLPRFHQIYNQSVREYRRLHRLRSATHPVPELESRGEWLEAPFWIWRAGDQIRDRPFVRRLGSELEMRDRNGWSIKLPISKDEPLDNGAAALVELGRQQIRLRTRALTTTLFARLCLADLFVHGIGGAKYDAMTDQICERFFGMAPPKFATVSATVHLPLTTPYPVSQSELLHVQHAIRDCRYNPDRHLVVNGNSTISELTDRKHTLLSTIAGRKPSRQEHVELARINETLFGPVNRVCQELIRQRDDLRLQLSANSVLNDREFAWCLHPSEAIESFMRREFLQAAVMP